MVKMLVSPEKLYEIVSKKGMLISPDAYITANFSWREVLKNQTDKPTLKILQNLAEVIKILQKYRNTIFKSSPIIITSGWRSAQYNKKIGGASRSYHLSGMALDFYIPSIPVKTVNQLIKNYHTGGKGYGTGFSHIDIGPNREWVY